MAEAASQERQYDLILIGKTGTGKSSTGNTILGRDVFSVSDSTASATERTEVAYDKINDDVIVKVIDTPGIVDTRTSNDWNDWMKEAANNLSQGFQHCPNGFHALILVLKYGSRYTQEEQDTVAFLKSMFGENVIKDHGILVFTNGENFTMYARHKDDLTFEDWCEGQTGALGDLIKESDNRAVLFHNLSEELREESIQNLLALVEKIGKRYTCEMFDQIKGERDRFIAEAGFHEMKENIEARIDIAIGKMERMKQAGLSQDQLERRMSDLRNEVILLEKEIKKEDDGKNKLNSMNTTIKILLNAIGLSGGTDNWGALGLVQKRDKPNNENSQNQQIFQVEETHERPIQLDSAWTDGMNWEKLFTTTITYAGKGFIEKILNLLKSLKPRNNKDENTYRNKVKKIVLNITINQSGAGGSNTGGVEKKKCNRLY